MKRVVCAPRPFLARRWASSAPYTTPEALNILNNHFSPAVPRAPKNNNIVVSHAKGVWITDVNGKKWLDCQTGIGVTSTGHCHPHVIDAVTEQVRLGIHLQQNCTISQPVLRLLEKLNEVTMPGISRFFFNVSGSEAVESAVKLARHETGKTNVIVFQGGFHGRSAGTMAMTTSKYVYRVGYGPLPSGVHVAKFPFCFHCTGTTGPDWTQKKQCCGSAIESIHTLFREGCHPSETAAIVIEPVLGEGGYVPTPPGFLRQLRRICDENNIMLVMDEVQSGVGRTGKFFAVEHEEGVTPDIIVFAKAIASGLPLSGIATRPEYMKKSPPGSMGGTYGANAVSAAAAVATIEVIQQEKLLENATARGEQLQAGLRAIARKYPGVIADVRGKGCMVGLEFAYPTGSGFSGAVTQACMDHGALLLLTTGWRETIRFIPALVMSKEEMDEVIQRFEKGLEVALKEWKGVGPVELPQSCCGGKC